ncbi:MAG: FAD-dependent hydroxylase [Hormoscilla sp. SP5CHS1]|nr:FAD-dependent hydroxylase [Hormoscilla sp. SP5CHS1]
MAVAQLEIPSTREQKTQWDYDIAIVGAGIVGATLACALKDSGLKLVSIDLLPQELAASKQQAYALTLLSGRILSGLGLWSEILPHVTTFRQISLSDTNQSFVQFRLADLGTDALGYVASHRVLLTTLQQSLNQSDNITWLCPAEVLEVDYQADAVKIAVNKAGQRLWLQTRLLVAADGGRSPIRAQAGIGTHGWKYWQSCVSTTIKPEKCHDNIAYERFWPTGPMGVLPLPGNRCQVVWTAPHAEAKALQELDEAEFLALLEQRTAGQLGRLELAIPRALYPVQLMQSDRYVKPRLALIGDAAHCCHPVGGQGLNMGIRDAAALAELLVRAHQTDSDIGDIRILQPYENWRQRENMVILGFTDFLDRIFSNNWIPVVALRRLGLWMLRSFRPFRYLALRLMTGLGGRSPELARRSRQETHRKLKIEN